MTSQLQTDGLSVIQPTEPKLR